MYLLSPLCCALILAFNGLSSCLSPPHNDNNSHHHHHHHQKNLSSSPIPNPMHWGIVMAVGARPYDPNFLYFYYHGLASLKSQIFTSWTLIIVGDNLNSHQERMILEHIQRSELPSEKVIYESLPYNYTQKHIYEDVLKRGQKPEFWYHVGTGAFNFGMKIIRSSLPNVTHVKFFDDDDILLPMHLDRLRQAYEISDDIGYAYTSGYNILTHVCTVTACPNLGYTTFTPDLPRFSGALSSSMSWKLDILPHLQFRLDFEQIKLMKKWKIIPADASDDQATPKILPNDGFLYLEVAHSIKESQSILDPLSSVVYITHKVRADYVREYLSRGLTKSLIPGEGHQAPLDLNKPEVVAAGPGRVRSHLARHIPL